MGIILNPKATGFKEALSSEIYVDKSDMIVLTNAAVGTKQKYICMSRPRRFGKSMTAEMLSSYYGKKDTSELFAGLKITKEASYHKYLNHYHVLQINMTDYFTKGITVKNGIKKLCSRILYEINEEFQDMRYFEPDNLIDVLETIYSKTEEQFVIIIDEWDYIFRQNKNDAEAQTEYLDFLRNFLKDKPYVALAYMTGILPIKKYGEHSALNMFLEVSVTEAGKYAPYSGFTEEEVESLCKKYGMSFEEVKSWYDGYCVEGVSIYAPQSVVMAMLNRKFRCYWTQTESYEALKIYIKLDIDGLHEKIKRLIAGEHISVNILKFQNNISEIYTADDVFTLLIHLGYLTYDFAEKRCWIPNNEVVQEFVNCIEDDTEWKAVADAVHESDRLIKATIQGDTKTVEQTLEKVHQENTSILEYNDENSLSCVISLAYFAARKYYHLKRELPEGKGFADLSFLPRKNSAMPAMVVELKWDMDADTAIRQIYQKQYSDDFADYFGEVLLVGINYNRRTKQHECRIEKIKKC